MPAFVPFIPLIAAGVGGATAITGAKMASNSNNRALQAQRNSTIEAERLQREQMAQEQKQFEAQQEMQRRAWDAQEQQRQLTNDHYDTRRADLAPYRAAGVEGLGNIRSLMSPQGLSGWYSISNAGRTGTIGDLMKG